MEKELEFLNYIYENTGMGINSTEELIKIVQDEKFRQLLEKQAEEYNHIHLEAKDYFLERGLKEKELSKLTKAMTYISINVNTLIDKSNSHIANMLIQGSTMGIIQIQEKLNCFEDLDSSVKSLGDKLLKFEQDNIEDLKKYL